MNKAEDNTVKNEASKTDDRSRDTRPMFEKRKERKRPRTVADQKYRRIKPKEKTYCDNSYKMSSTPRKEERRTPTKLDLTLLCSGAAPC